MQTAASSSPGLRQRIARRLGTLRRDQSGVSVIEFAISLPIFVTLGMYGMEIAYMQTADMQISQLALSVADNASRLGQTDNSAVAPTISESDIDAVLGGGEAQGAPLGFAEHGRIILSSLEKETSSGRQYFHWQRCRGGLVEKQSSYGPQDYGLAGDPLTAVGEPGKQVAAEDGKAVMFVEVFYQYQPLFGQAFVKDMKFREEAKFVVRDNRNLSGPGVTGGLLNEC